MSFEAFIEETVRRVIREELRSALAERPGTSEDRRVTATEAAAAAGVSPATLRHWASDGKVRRYGDGRNQRYSLAEVLALANAVAPDKQTTADRVGALLRRHHG